MNEQQRIEVGDVVRWETDGKEYVVEKIQQFTNEVVTLEVVGGVCREVVTLVRKAAKDPYAGLTLPEPPKGYRLLEWGGTASLALWWDGTGWVQFRDVLPSCYETTHARRCIFAVPIESTLPRTWQFREQPWTAPEPKTLADCREGVDAIVTASESQMGEQLVMRRRGEKACYSTRAGEKESCYAPNRWAFVRYLDPQPSPPLTLEQVPDGRCFQISEGDAVWYWKHSYKGLHRILVGPDPLNGEIRETTFSGIPFITNLIAEFR